MAFRRDPPYDARYGPRARSRSPPGTYERRQSGPIGAQFHNNSQRDRDFPPGPRGTAFGGYNKDDANDSYGQGPRPVSATRDRFYPRDRDGFDRRASFRDGPASPRISDGPPQRSDARDGHASQNTGFSGSAFGSQRGGPGQRGGRFRGRAGYDDHRSRRPPPPAFDDRPHYRRGSSPPPRYGSRDGPLDDTDRRPDHRYQDRDFRERDPGWGSRREYDTAPSRFDAKSNTNDSRPPTPSQPKSTTSSGPAYSRARDFDSGRRASATATYGTANNSRYDAPKSAVATTSARSDKKFDRPNRTDSPPPQAPSVPAFGSFAFTPTAAAVPPAQGTSGVTDSIAESSSVVRSGPEQKQDPSNAAQPSKSETTPQDLPSALKSPEQRYVTKPPPSLHVETHVQPSRPVKVDPDKTPATAGPEGRAPPKQHSSGEISETFEQSSKQDVTDTATTPRVDEIKIPTGPAALRNHHPTRRFTNPPHRSPPANFFSPANSPRHGQANPELARSQSFSSQNTASAALFQRIHEVPDRDKMPKIRRASQEVDRGSHRNVQLGRATSPPAAPTGPRAQAMSTSPRTGPPTAPRAERMPPPGSRGTAIGRAPDAPYTTQVRLPHGPRALVWTNPKALATARDSVVPMKRTSSGGAVDHAARPAPAGSFSENSERLQRITAAAAANTDSSPKYDAKTEVPQPTEEQLEDKIIKNRMDLDDIGDPVEPMLDDASSDDGMDLDEDDVEVTRAKFDNQRARLEAQLVDLSDRKVRATTPLAHLAKLSMIDESHLVKYRRSAPEPEPEPEIPDPVAEAGDTTPMFNLTSQKSLSPKDEEVEDLAVRRREILQRLPPNPRHKPDEVHLPFLARSPVSPKERFSKDGPEDKNARQAILDRMLDIHRDQLEHETDLVKRYAVAYRRFALLSQQLDDERASKEDAEAQATNEYDITSADSGPLSAETPTLDSSRRLHKFSSEYEMQRVLKESEETARIEQEKVEKATKKAKDDLEKEAVVPTLFTEEMVERRLFVNRNTWHDSLYLTEVFGFNPPIDTFSTDEQRTFAVAFKERPKRWGEIAELLPGRTYQDCIHHYYANKWDGRFRETKGKRRSKMGRGRGGRVGRVRGAALMADLGRVEEDAPLGEGASTTTGRPKRAATNRTAQADKEKEKEKEKEREREREAEAAKSAASMTPNKRAVKPDVADAVMDKDKPSKHRRKRDPGERTSRKPKTQLSATAAPNMEPPLPTLEYSQQDVVMEDIAPVQDEGSPVFGERVLPNAILPPGPEDTGTLTGVYTDGPLERPRGASGGQGPRPAASSYWSVPEQQDFVKFISYFGTDFVAIAAHMGTKTTTMVKNYYQRSVDGGSRPDFEVFAKAGNERRERGEDIGPPPAPTQTVKRRYDTGPGGIGPHNIAGADGAAIVPGARTQAVPKLVSSTMPQSQSHIVFDPTRGDGITAQGPVAGRIMGSPIVPKPDPDHPVGVFDGRPGQPVPMQVRSLQPSVDASGKPIEAQDTTSPWYQELSREIVVQREHDARGPPQLRGMHDHTMSNGPPQHAGPVFAQRDRPISAHAPGPLRGTFRDEGHMSPAFMPGARPGQGVLRSVLGPPHMSPIGPSQDQFTRRDHSPPKYGGFRPSSVPATLANQPPPLTAPQKVDTSKDPPRRSNLAALLNSEPEEPRRKRPADQISQPATRPQSPAQMPPRGPTPTQQPQMQGRHDAYDKSHMGYERPGMSAASPATPYETGGGHWTNPPSARPPDEWNHRQSIVSQPYHATHSPNPMQYERERPPLFQHRQSTSHSHVLPHGSRGRTPPSGHPQPAAGHSRTSSYGQSTPIEKPGMPRPPFGFDPRDHQGPYASGKPYAYPHAPSPQTQQPRGLPYSQEEADRGRYEQERGAYERDRERQYRAGQAGSPYAYQGPPQPVAQDMSSGQYSGQPPPPQYRQGSISERSGGLREMAAREGMDAYMREQYARGQQAQIQQQQRMDYEKRYGDYGRRPSTASARKDFPPPPPGTWHDGPGGQVPGQVHGQPGSAYPRDEHERRQLLEANLRAEGAIVPRTGHVNQPPSGLPLGMGYPPSQQPPQPPPRRR